MSQFKLDRTAFKPQTQSDAASHRDYYVKLTWKERLSVTAYLNSVAFGYQSSPPPRLNRNKFSVKSSQSNG
jgi:hypothetical protein